MAPKTAMPQKTSLRSWTWLGSGQAYEQVRRALIFYFAGNGCGTSADELADKVFERVDQKLAENPEFAEHFQGNPARFFQVVAKYILKESRRPSPVIAFPAPSEATEIKEARALCLDHCLESMPTRWGLMVQEYHRYQGAKKKRKRREMAEELQISMNALRLRMYKLRRALYGCMADCLEEKGY